MKGLLFLLIWPAILVLLPAAAHRLRGSIYDEPFSTPDLSFPPQVRIGLSGGVEVASLRVRVEGPVRLVDASGTEVLWEGTELDESVAPQPAPGPGMRFGQRLSVGLDEAVVVPVRPGSLRVGNRRYRGTLRLAVRGPRRLLTAVNEIDLERYLASVVTSEVKPDWPPEMLRAQAVVARGYALYEMRAGFGRRTRGFDLYDDDRSQCYLGMAGESSSAAEAARDTYGEVCLFREKLFRAFYQNTCGGRTEAARIVFLEQNIPPLEGRTCGYCDLSRHFRWQVEIPKRDLAAKVFDTKAFGPVPAVRILERTPGGLVLKVGVISPLKGNHVLEMTGKAFARKVDADRFKSLAFDVREDRDRFVFEGRGWGHLVGLCQEGAKGMAERVPGTTYRGILEYYYPGATVGRAY